MFAEFKHTLRRMRGQMIGWGIGLTLYGVLMARIDRLEAPTRDLVQVASVIDRSFPYATLHGIYPYPMPDLEMQVRLNETVRPHDLTRLERPEPDLVYLFKHALTREVAYASLPFARRRQLHQRMGEFIETTYADHLEEHYGTLAYHFDQSKQWERALRYALQAGTQAQEVYANDEALRYYRQVEDYLAHLSLEAHWARRRRGRGQRSRRRGGCGGHGDVGQVGPGDHWSGPVQDYVWEVGHRLKFRRDVAQGQDGDRRPQE